MEIEVNVCSLVNGEGILFKEDVENVTWRIALFSLIEIEVSESSLVNR